MIYYLRYGHPSVLPLLCEVRAANMSSRLVRRTRAALAWMWLTYQSSIVLQTGTLNSTIRIYFQQLSKGYSRVHKSLECFLLLHRRQRNWCRMWAVLSIISSYKINITSKTLFQTLVTAILNEKSWLFLRLNGLTFRGPGGPCGKAPLGQSAWWD